MTVSPGVTALEALLARKKELGSLRVSLDGYHRWGHGSDDAWADKAGKEASEYPHVVAELEAKVASLRDTDPDAIEAWADAHVTVLDDYLGRVAEDSVEASVARGERAEWKRVRSGQLAYVDENTVYVRPDPALYERLFGIKPAQLHW